MTTAILNHVTRTCFVIMAGSITPGSLWGEEGMHDAVLLSILKSCGKIQPFFEYIFSFLSRRTDFYIIMEQEQAEMGFPPGMALNMVIQVTIRSFSGHAFYLLSFNCGITRNPFT